MIRLILLTLLLSACTGSGWQATPGNGPPTSDQGGIDPHIQVDVAMGVVTDSTEVAGSCMFLYVWDTHERWSISGVITNDESGAAGTYTPLRPDGTTKNGSEVFCDLVGHLGGARFRLPDHLAPGGYQVCSVADLERRCSEPFEIARKREPR